jgi:hypothetical protein
METFDGAPAPDNAMPDAEFLARASAFDPTQKTLEHKVKILTLALQIIEKFSDDPGATEMAAQALRECK